ncbi:MAG: phosphoribosylformylglycinamidine synthase subunit PurL [Chloroflexi bacterium]|nr:phosphoribosylformylglycinamidine synthase subunit PurL [Chloroflexota bacterium]MYD16340.1 phosphoribosylformylglycinamidine synthase subunit PurL [Chloroflexota bacterium]MYJ01926.1 phosphoribosylformylglycinamidine synthase subunit PurL [Chloroflexota bacterium]
MDDDVLAQIALSRDEFERACDMLGRAPSDVELGMIGALWSEHCGYKHSRPLFHHFPTEDERILTNLGEENAGAIDIGDGWVAVMKIESHNHPSAIEPYEGAATGVGGIVRDIFAMGAQPIALLDSLRFGPLDDRRNRRLCSGVVAGIGGYGNCLGIPTVGGELVVGESYSGNPLVNAMCLGIAPRGSLISATAGPPGTQLMIVGADTGRDGLHGATFASVELDEASAERRPAVQVGNPFLEKSLMDACVGLVRKHRDWLEGLQDCGAAGITSSTVEMAERAGAGIRIQTQQVPRRESGMTPYEVMLSESQERMIAAVKPAHVGDVQDWFEHWDLHAEVIGDVTDDGLAKVYDGEREVAAAPVSLLTGPPAYEPDAKRDPDAASRAGWDPGTLADLEPMQANDALLRLLASPNVASKRWVYRQYDHMVGTNTVITPGSDAAVLRIRGLQQGLALCTDGPGRAVELDPYSGAARAVAEAARNIACTGARPVAVTDCLNFANPERAPIYYQLRESIRGMADACRAFRTPVVSGNASLYNESEDGPVTPTPVVGMLGIISDVTKVVRMAFQDEGDEIWLLGGGLEQDASTLGGSEYLSLLHGRDAGPVEVDLEAEAALVDVLVEAAEAGLLKSAHDCSDGGLAVAVCESAIAGGIGASIDAEIPGRLDAALFGEAGGRAVVSIAPDQGEQLAALAVQRGVRAARIGRVAAARLELGPMSVPLTEASEAWTSALPRLLDS